MILKKVFDILFENKIVILVNKSNFTPNNDTLSGVYKLICYLIILIGITAAFVVLPLPTEPNFHGFVFGSLKILFFINILFLLFKIIDIIVQYLEYLAKSTDSKLDNQLLPILRKALKTTIFIICSIWLIQNLGYNVTSLIAGLGIGGLAIALALQDTLGNFFGTIFIFLDRPFAVGDWIKVEGTEGVVEDIGFRSTRIRTFPTTLVSIPNKTMASITIENCSKMPKRRVFQTIGLTYDADSKQIQQAVNSVKDIITNDDGVDKEVISVRFTEFADYSLNIIAYYFTKAVKYDEHFAIKERINLAIMDKLKELGLSIAFPTRTIYLEGKDVSKNN